MELDFGFDRFDAVVLCLGNPGSLSDGLLSDAENAVDLGVDFVNQYYARGRRIDSALYSLPVLRHLGQYRCADHYLRPDQLADCRVDGLHLFLRNSRRHPRGGTDRWGHHLGRALACPPADDAPGSLFDRAAPGDLVVE